jgi:hypothetical protein
MSKISSKVMLEPKTIDQLLIKPCNIDPHEVRWTIKRSIFLKINEIMLLKNITPQMSMRHCAKNFDFLDFIIKKTL